MRLGTGPVLTELPKKANFLVFHNELQSHVTFRSSLSSILRR